MFGINQTYEELKDNYVQTAIEIARNYDSVEDMPWPLLYRELDQEFPGSKFILSVRSTEKWYKSVCGHFRDGAGPLELLTYGEDMVGGAISNPERFCQTFEQHNQNVIDYFAQRPGDLLVLDMEAGHGWAELGAFLGRSDVPSGPFPHVNSAKERRTFANRVRNKLIRMGVPLPRIGG